MVVEILKILTITCHRSYNYGAILQAYALQQYILSKGVETEIIDYYPLYLREPRDEISKSKIKSIIWKIYRYPDFLRGEKVFGDFIKKYIRLTDACYRTYDELEKNAPYADYYFTGSDQVWNFNMENGNDDSYFLGFVKDNFKKCSYAASMPVDEMTEIQKERFKLLLKDYYAISVRETTAKLMLETAGISDIATVLDPVYLLTAEQWRNLSYEFDKKEPYVLVYGFNSNRQIISYAKNLAKRKKCKLYVINSMIIDYRIRGNRHFTHISPNLFISLFDNADYVVTNSFHGLAFSLIFQKEFYVFSKTTGGNSRLLDMLELVNLKRRLITNNETDCDNIDYRMVHNLLNKEIEKSKKFINNIIDREYK